MRTYRVLAVMAAVTAAVAVGGTAGASPVSGWTTRVAVTTFDSMQGYNYGVPALSADGRFVAFASEDSTLVPGDTNGQFDVFVRDMRTGTTTRVSLTSTGGQVMNGASQEPAISGDGRYVAFVSYGTNVVPGDRNTWGNVFVRDLVAGTTRRVGPSTAGMDLQRIEPEARISADGRYVTYHTNAALSPTDTNQGTDVYVWTRDSGALERVSVPTAAGNSAGGHSGDVSGDGRYVVFNAPGQPMPDGYCCYDQVYVRDRHAGTTSLITRSLSGTDSEAFSSSPRISENGRYVVYASSAMDLVPDTPDFGNGKVFLYDRVTGMTERISPPVAGEWPIASGGGEVSADGRYVTFATSTLYEEYVVMRRDRWTGMTVTVNLATDGTTLTPAFSPTIAPDGRTVAWIKREVLHTPEEDLMVDAVYVRRLQR